ncbi:MAG: hypothetical protein JXB88_04470 [Spirochaetales bacterium]|nr:hypothetical protein [Spirochaetales bacterium]
MKKGLFATLLILCMSLFILGCQFDMAVDTDSEIINVKSDADTGPVKKIIKDTGVIRYINLEGGFYGIIGRKGNYDPVNLPRVFMQDGLAVEFTAEVLEDMASIHMWGTLVRLISMKTLDTTEKKLIMDEGVVHQRFIQGYPWLIEATTGTYQILNLPNSFQIEGLKVRFVGVIRDDINIMPPLWPLVEIIEIEKIGGPEIIRLGERFKLPVGQSAYEPRQKILFTFKSVLQDSRCPSDVVCFWEGEAIILVNVNIAGRDYGDFKMSTHVRPSVIYVGRYSIRFLDLVPYPVSTDPIDPDEYVGYFLIDFAYIINDTL